MCVRESERHHKVLVVPSWSVERRLPLISLPYLDQVVGVLEIQLHEEACLLERGEGRGDERNGVAILHCDGVETSVIDAGPERTILFPHKEEAGACRG